jgi:2-alkyl-3-oxoalkanoate reductase
MRIAITGASGFCGSAVARLAHARGHGVVCFGRRPGPVGAHVAWDAAGDTPDLSSVDAVVHLAAAVGDADDAGWMRAVNVDGARRLLAATGSRPVVWVSSASVYSPGPYSGPVREDHPTGGQRSAYGRTKALGEAMALRAGAVVLRPRAVYGPGDPHLLPRLRRALRGGRVWLPGPDVPMSLTAVETLAGACLQALGWPPGAYNIADRSAYRRDDVVGTALGAPVRHVPVALAKAAAVAARAVGSKVLTRYAVDQLTDGMVLDIAKAAALGFRG